MTGRSEGSNETSGLPRVISPELRRRLQERYARAQTLLAQPSCDFAAAHRLLAENLALDPGNLRYIELMLVNLRRRGEASVQPGLWQRWIAATPLGARAALERAIAARRWAEAVRLVPEMLWTTGLQDDALGLAAEVCAGLELGPAELLYRKAAVDAAPASTEPIRRLARALKRMGMFADAWDWWRKLDELSPGDAEAAAELATAARSSEVAEAERPLRERIEESPGDVEALLALVELRLRAADFDEAPRLLAQASAVGGGDLRVRHGWEELSLAQSEHRLRLAQEAAKREDSDAARRLAAEIAEQHERLALGVAHARAERFPGDGALLLDLARRLKRSGNFSGAAQRFDELRQLPGFETTALVELGECWQHLRQFEKALDCYREAIAGPESADKEESRYLALYRGAVLAEALGRLEQACAWLRELVAATGGYKDARERLDKLRPMCDKNGFSAP